MGGGQPNYQIITKVMWVVFMSSYDDAYHLAQEALFTKDLETAVLDHTRSELPDALLEIAERRGYEWAVDPESEEFYLVDEKCHSFQLESMNIEELTDRSAIRSTVKNLHREGEIRSFEDVILDADQKMAKRIDELTSEKGLGHGEALHVIDKELAAQHLAEEAPVQEQTQDHEENLTILPAHSPPHQTWEEFLVTQNKAQFTYDNLVEYVYTEKILSIAEQSFNMYDFTHACEESNLLLAKGQDDDLVCVTQRLDVIDVEQVLGGDANFEVYTPANLQTVQQVQDEYAFIHEQDIPFSMPTIEQQQSVGDIATLQIAAAVEYVHATQQAEQEICHQNEISSGHEMGM